METDPTDVALNAERHPSLAELKGSSHPEISEHLERCQMCRSVVAADAEHGDLSEPIPLDLPKGLVSETAFRWPASAMARGGMAQIFAGEDRRLSRTVILKAPRDGDELPAGMAEMFQRRVTAEARILAKLQHPSIVTIYELGKASAGWPFCVLEQVDGVSLRDRLDELADAEAADGRPRTRERLELLSNLVSIAEALAYAHERRVVHRDCTPNNILLGKRGEATLIDWGIARDLDAPGGLGGLTDPSLAAGDAGAGGGTGSPSGATISAGTPPYLPFEQTQGHPADPSFDVYSFGVTLYEVVSGRTPFDWKHVAAPEARTRQLGAFLLWLRDGEPPPPAMPRDPELSGIIARAMARRPAERFTADELVRALKQYLTGDLVFSHRYSRTGRLARWARRHRAATVALISAVLFAIGGALVWVQLSRRAEQEAELRAIAAAARADASEKGRAADQAAHEAETAEAAAEQAKRESKDADAMRHAAERKREAADKMRKEAEKAAEQAKGDANDAFKRYAEAQREKDEADRARDLASSERDAAKAAALLAQHERDAARAAELAAERDRDTARAAREAADKERDAARASASAAEADREAARTTAAAAAQEREAARAAQQAAEKERDAAVAARAGVERERDEARRKLAELEQRQRDREPAPRDREPAPRDREPAPHDREPAPRDREPARHPPDDRAPSAPSAPPAPSGALVPSAPSAPPAPSGALAPSAPSAPSGPSS
ncbi:MAG TPA: protein kinase [Kofleriaceae bacterium]|nr:protein kinase [Kofleriaceae bacterium]